MQQQHGTHHPPWSDQPIDAICGRLDGQIARNRRRIDRSIYLLYRLAERAPRNGKQIDEKSVFKWRKISSHITTHFASSSGPGRFPSSSSPIRRQITTVFPLHRGSTISTNGVVSPHTAKTKLLIIVNTTRKRNSNTVKGD